MTITAEQTQLEDGTQLGMLRDGSSEGMPVVLLHGIPTGSELWREIIPELAEQGHQSFALDLPGYGHTRLRKNSDYSIFATAQRIANWLESAELENVWLIAHDWGGAVAQVLAARHSERLSRLTLSNCPVEDSWPVPSVRLFRMLARGGLYAPLASIGFVPNPYANSQLNRAFYDRSSAAPDIWERVFWDSKVSDEQGRQEFQSHLAALDNSQTIEVAPELRKVDLPTLLIWGSHDRFQPWEKVGVRLQTLLPNPEVKLIERAGHFHVLEKPQAFVEALTDWRQSITEEFR